MAITILPIDRDPATGLPQYTAQQYRQARAAEHGGGSGRQLGLRSGFRVGTPSNVLTATSTTWTLGPCAAKLDVGEGVTQGGYDWANDSNFTGSGAQGVQAADSTNPRKDIVYIQVNDSSAGDGSGAVTANVLYLAGTPGVTPAAPTLPARSFLVGTISVPVAGGGSPTVALNPARYVAAGGLLPVSGTADRATITTPYVGQEIQRTDLTQLSPAGVKERWNGTNWEHFGHAEFTTAANQVPQNTAWGMGVFTRDSGPTTDDAFVTIKATDELQVRDAGLYSVTVLPSFITTAATPTATISGISWLSVDGSYTVTMGGGLQNFAAALPNVRLAAGAVIKPLLAHGSGGDRTFTSRVRVTRIA